MSNSKRLKCFISYSHKDKRLCDRFLVHLSCVNRFIDTKNWYDGRIPPGGNISEEITKQLLSADIIFLLISPDFIASHYCYEIELKEAVKRHNDGKCQVIPVIIKDYPNGDYLFSKLKFVPTDGRAVTDFQSHDKGFIDAFDGITYLLESSTKNINATNKEEKKTSSSKGKKSNIEPKQPINCTIVKNGTPKPFELTSDLFNTITHYGFQLSAFIENITTLFKVSINSFIDETTNTAPYRTMRYHRNLEIFILQLSAYIQQHFIGYDNTCIHFRRKSDDTYKDLFEIGYSKNKLSKNPISAYNGMIACSQDTNMPVIKKHNNKLHKATHPNEKMSRNYITCAFNNISRKYNIDLSMCISIVGTASTSNANMLLAMSIMRFDLLIEKFIIQFIESCKSIDNRYDVNIIFNNKNEV